MSLHADRRGAAQDRKAGQDVVIRRRALGAAFVGALAAPLALLGQRMWRLGYLGLYPLAAPSQEAANDLLLGLQDLGYVRDRDFTIDFRDGAGHERSQRGLPRAGSERPRRSR